MQVQFTDDEPLSGLATAREGLGRSRGSITGMGHVRLHEPLDVDGDDQRLVPEALDHYGKPGASDGGATNWHPDC